MTGEFGSPLAPVQPDDPPRRLCQVCGAKYNPYRHNECPHKDDHDKYE
jgi:hypothetical protein